ncbi:FAD-dependent monooxygenase [Endozoicomonas gorgoniicola]|uniref:FAD-dependent monooxygenase n=1 Tax=Endozoicomonas gorgoniicola TaxID=1234144 RepID=A0ABT3N0Y1_9GAMM|nr:FAD-dependent monooxygenase [Endozoicomonas gorgoniicola]MCW7555277.1 FAD-dependent monooxygenase [Endozoicomonas gorgoniicola]
MSKKHYDVLVVGGGMVGAALAAALGLHGITVAIFDQKMPEPFSAEALPDIRVSALSQASEALLQKVGAWSRMQSMRMCPYRKMAVWEKLEHSFSQHFNQTLFDAADAHFEQLGFIVENRVTQLGLLEALKDNGSVDLHCPVTIEHINLSGQQPELILQDGRAFTGELLVGADGAQSRVREQAGIRLETSEYAQQCFVATVEIAGGQQDITWQAFTPTGPEAFLPLPDINGRSYASVVWYHQPEPIRRLMLLANQHRTDELIDEIVTTFPGELPEIKALHECSYFPLARRHAATYYKPGVVLVGDAAHTINPLAGQGVNLGFQDVAWLAQHLFDAKKQQRNPGSVDVLAGYEKARRKDNLLMMSTMDAFYYTFSNNSLPLKLARNAMLAIAGKNRLAVTQVMKYAMGVSGKKPEWLLQ